MTISYSSNIFVSVYDFESQGSDASETFVVSLENPGNNPPKHSWFWEDLQENDFFHFIRNKILSEGFEERHSFSFSYAYGNESYTGKDGRESNQPTDVHGFTIHPIYVIDDIEMIKFKEVGIREDDWDLEEKGIKPYNEEYMPVKKFHGRQESY